MEGGVMTTEFTQYDNTPFAFCSADDGNDSCYRHGALGAASPPDA